MKFVEELSEKILSSCGTDLRSVAVVLSSRRSGLFLKKALAKAAGKTLLLPQIMSIEEYIFRQSGLQKMDETTMLTLLYTVYKDYAKEEAFSLDDFLPTGKTLLADFNDVDDYLLNPEEVFTYLSRVKEIENWIPGEVETELQKKYLSFYLLLNPIYKMFLKKCIELSMGYQGLASRILSEKDDVYGFSKVIFAGLNAVAPSLEAHINKLVLKNKTILVWDADAWYLDNNNHEAGHFMRLNRAAWPETFGEPVMHFEDKKKEIEVIGSPLGYSQVQVALSLLEGKYKDAFSDTVIVLADEGLLMPLLSSLPDDWENRVNISGGYPLRNTLLGQLMMAQLELLAGALPDNNGTPVYRYESLLELVANPLIRLLPDENNKKEFAETVEEISSGRIRYFRWNAEAIDKPDAVLLKRFEMLIPGSVSPCTSWEEALIRLENLTGNLFEKCQEVDLEHEASWQVHSMLKALRNTLTGYGNAPNITIDAVVFFVRRQLQVAKIPLKGEPLQGIQILGMLETRSLDFRNVIILGANEGFLPASGHGDSFLPNDVRHELGLPLMYERDAVYAYHFWRLIQRASEITLIYNTENDPVFGKEPSRFLAQIEHELLPAFPETKWSRKVLGIEYLNNNTRPFKMASRENIDKVLDETAIKGLSFSAFFNYIECPYRFLLSGIYKVREWEDETGDIASNTMGSVFHAAIEKITGPFIGKVLLKQDFDTMISVVDVQIEAALSDLKVPHIASGYNFLVKEILHDALIGWLRRMKDAMPIDYYVKAVEVMLTPEIQLPGGRKVMLRGIADRVEMWNGTLRVMDFKTTHKRTDFIYDVSPDADVATQINSPNRYLIQVLFYAWLYSIQENVGDVTGGVYPVLNNSGHNPDLIKNKNKDPIILNKAQIDAFGEAVILKISEIFSPEQTFKATPSENGCQYCPYNSVICFENALENMEDE